MLHDALTVGHITLQNLTLAIGTGGEDAQSPSDTHGIMGIGLASNEALLGGMGFYDNIIDVMVKEGKIKSRSFSLWLDDVSTDDLMSSKPWTTSG